MPELSVNRKSVGKLFSEMQNKKFIIPDFQRPYSWDVEKCEILWQDIINFLETEENTQADYFLGTIVSNKDENENNEIIDGQQRITTLSLILRAFYYKLEQMPQNDKNVVGLMNKVAPCIWNVDEISNEITDRESIHIESFVATDDDNQVFHTILKTGEITKEAEDNYSMNYAYFLKVCSEYAEKNPVNWEKLCVTILNKCIILPIECSSQETALTIFTTLNDRGMPLDDSDIFKAQIYRKMKTKEARAEFTEQWKELSNTCAAGVNLNINDIFRYYTHVIRARNGMGASEKEIGLRRFYAENKYERLNDEKIMSEVMRLANFWYYLNKRDEPENEEGYTISLESRKYIDCLFYYPNEYWKYVASVYFMKNNDKTDFEKGFCSILKKVTTFMFAKFITTPTVNAVKPDVFNACVSIEKGQNFWNDIKFTITSNNFYSSVRITRSLLLLHAYLNPQQVGIIPYDCHIEHILPKKWQAANYNGWDKEQAQEWLENFGNRVVFEKKLNIQAGNGYFGRKKERYAQSNIADIKDLANYASNDFTVDDIKNRENEFISRLTNFFVEQGVC